MQNLPTTNVTVANKTVPLTDYYWSQIADTWEEAVYTWDDVVQQFPPDFIAISSPVTNIANITNL